MPKMAPSTFGRGQQCLVAVFISGALALGVYFYVTRRKKVRTDSSTPAAEAKDETKPKHRQEEIETPDSPKHHDSIKSMPSPPTSSKTKNDTFPQAETAGLLASDQATVKQSEDKEGSASEGSSQKEEEKIPQTPPSAVADPASSSCDVKQDSKEKFLADPKETRSADVPTLVEESKIEDLLSSPKSYASKQPEPLAGATEAKPVSEPAILKAAAADIAESEPEPQTSETAASALKGLESAVASSDVTASADPVSKQTEPNVAETGISEEAVSKPTEPTVAVPTGSKPTESAAADLGISEDVMSKPAESAVADAVGTKPMTEQSVSSSKASTLSSIPDMPESEAPNYSNINENDEMTSGKNQAKSGTSEPSASNETTAFQNTTSNAGSKTLLHDAKDEDFDKMISEVENSSHLTSEQAGLLVSLLTSPDEDLLLKVLVTIGNASAFTANQDTFREVGCLPQLSRLLQVHAVSLSVHPDINNLKLVTSLITALNNLAQNEYNQSLLQECIQPLVEFASSETIPEGVQLGSLQTLTNLSVTSTNHAPYTKVVQSLYEQVDKGADPVKIQAVKLLVNLSCNPDMVAHLLAAKAPSCLLESLSPDTNEGFLVRWTTLIANIVTTVEEKNISSATLPAQHKAPSPETMFTALYGINNSKLKSKVFVLSKHSNDDVRIQANRIHACFS